MKLKNMLLSCAIVSASILGITSANAACVIRGNVVQVATNGNGTNVYVSNIPEGQGAVPYVYYFSTSNMMISSVLASSLGKNIYVTGNAGSCPASGTYRYGGIITAPGIYVK